MPNACPARSAPTPCQLRRLAVAAITIAAVSLSAGAGRSADCDEWSVNNDGLLRSGVRLGTVLGVQRNAVTRVANGPTSRWLDALKIDAYTRGQAQTNTMEVYACSPGTEIVVGTVVGQAEPSRTTRVEWLRDQQGYLATVARAVPVKDETATDIYLWVVKEQSPVGTTDLRDAVIHRNWCRKGVIGATPVCSTIGWEVYRVRTPKDLP